MIITLAARVAQLLLAAVILAISSVLIHGYGPQGHNPSLIDYGAVCGGGAIIIAAVGVLAIFFEPIQGIVMLGLDGLASFFLLAGGLGFAIQAKTGRCTDPNYVAAHANLFKPSDYKWDPESKGFAKDYVYDVENRCRMVQATTAFVWVTFGLFLATVALGLKNKTTKRGGNMV